MGSPDRSTWDVAEGDVLVEGRTALKLLGGGHWHEALLVWDDRRAAVMVAKALRPRFAEDPQALQALRAEADALDALAHPVIVRGFDAVLDGPRPHLLLEHLEGPTLRSLLRRGGPLGLEQLLPLALHVASALHFAAQSGWVHLDVKPDNIIMGAPPRLIDLSLARTTDRAARLSGPTGTDAYMPPEQCAPGRFPGAIGRASDVFGLGATLFHAVAGERPYPRPEGARESEVAEVRFPQLAVPPIDLPPRTPAPLAALLHHMLAPDPGARPSAGEVVERLEPLAGALPRRLVLGRRGMRMR